MILWNVFFSLHFSVLPYKILIYFCSFAFLRLVWSWWNQPTSHTVLQIVKCGWENSDVSSSVQDFHRLHFEIVTSAAASTPKEGRAYPEPWPGPVFCLLLGVSSDYAQPITGQVTEVTCPVIGRAQPELTPSKIQKMGPDDTRHSACWSYPCWITLRHWDPGQFHWLFPAGNGCREVASRI